MAKIRILELQIRKTNLKKNLNFIENLKKINDDFE